MKRLYIVVEGQTEQEFVNTVLRPYFNRNGLYSITPILIHTSVHGRGGFVNYQHLKNNINRLLKSEGTDIIVSTFVDFFRCPALPYRELYETITDHSDRVEAMERCIANDINDRRFIPYIQLHEFEALLFASNKGFEVYLTAQQSVETQKIVDSFPNPESINSSPENAPSKRLLAIKNDYDKVIEGCLIALEMGILPMLDKCPRFSNWVNALLCATLKNQY